MKFILPPIVFLLSFVIWLSSCFEENYISDNTIQLEFSKDTIRFDTVFTTVGSATRSVKIFNTSNNNILISSIYLSDRAMGMFRLNIDGTPANRLNNVRILAKDSLYIFVEVTIDPDQPLSASPFIVSDEIIIDTGREAQAISLEAWGQNANYFPGKNAAGQLIRLTCNNNELTWDDPRPYVVYGLLFIDSCSLVIAPGTRVYFHGGLARLDDLIFTEGGLVFLPDGRLIAQGTKNRPVTFQGDRLETDFAEVAGQWPGLRFLDGSRGNIMDHCEIKNSIVGVRVDSSAELTLSSSRIHNILSAGVIGIHADIRVDNSLIHSTGGQSCILAYGGNYQFRHCTLANFENQAPAIYLDNFNCLDSECLTVDLNDLNVLFVNSLITGNNDDEMEVADASGGSEPGSLSIILDHSLVNIEETKANINFGDICQTCIEYRGEPLFLDTDMKIFSLDTMSIARDKGVFIPELEKDLAGNPRDRNTPDLGCFEFIQ